MLYIIYQFLRLVFWGKITLKYYTEEVFRVWPCNHHLHYPPSCNFQMQTFMLWFDICQHHPVMCRWMDILFNSGLVYSRTYCVLPALTTKHPRQQNIHIESNSHHILFCDILTVNSAFTVNHRMFSQNSPTDHPGET